MPFEIRRVSRGSLLGLGVLCALGGFGDAAAGKRKKRPPPPKRLIERPSGPLSLSVEGLDLDDGKVVVLIGGAARAIDPRLFTFHDDKKRAFVALGAKCEPALDPKAGPAQAGAPPATNKIRCTLDYPRAYVNAVVNGLSVTIGGREIEAPADEVARKFDSARSTAVLPRAIPPPATVAPAERKSADGGVAEKPAPRAGFRDPLAPPR